MSSVFPCPGPYSSEGSRSDARQLAENLGIEFLTLPISEVFNSYRTALSEPFPGRPEDVTEENLQARIRGNFLMALSNKFGSMVLSTGNKSEMAVGYCTLYGDMAGGLALLSDVPKTMVYALAELINHERELIPHASIEKPPSAELRPNQKDQDSLPPYDVLDRILKSYIEDVKSSRGNCSPLWLRSGIGSFNRHSGRSQRIQASSSPPRVENHITRLRFGPAIPHRSKIHSLRDK